MSKKYSAFLGRWSPFHNGHDYIVRQALDKGKSVWIAIRDTPISEWDPYTSKERLEMISEHYKDDDVVVAIIPDIESVNIGRKVGYDVNRYDAPENIEGISATKIREMMASGDQKWKDSVPKKIADFLISKEDLEIPSDKGIVIWLTGLSGAGKSTISNVLAPTIRKTGKPVKILDGDEVRENLTSDLGFSKEDRSENIKRISYVAKSIADCNGVAVVAAISPYIDDREKAKKLVGANRFFEIFVDCHIDTLIERDVKGLYAKALSGEIENFTGISDPYEVPYNANCTVNSGFQTLNESLDIIEQSLNVFLKDNEKEIMYYI